VKVPRPIQSPAPDTRAGIANAAVVVWVVKFRSKDVPAALAVS
jgi:hypothetical protein